MIGRSPRTRGIRTVIPERAEQKANRVRRGQAGGRPPAFDCGLHKARNWNTAARLAELTRPSG